MHKYIYIYPDFVFWNYLLFEIVMLFERDILSKLRERRQKLNRKPLVLRGARQVGKTTVVNLFAKEFDWYVYLNLETVKDRAFFTKFDEIEDTVEAILFTHSIPKDSERILIFIDEIQAEPKAVASLRYFYEKFPKLYVIAAGSLLETLLEVKNTFPVGRVEYLVMRPVSFLEFLSAIGEIQAYEAIQQIPVPKYAYQKLMDLFHTYALIGGMPEVVQEYIMHRDLVKLKPIYDSLLVAYLDDVQKYSGNAVKAEVLQTAIQSLFREAGKRIKFSEFAHASYTSRAMGEALRTLEKAMLIHLVYPAIENQLPASPNLRKAPYLQALDTGLMNFFSGIQADLIGTKDLHQAYRGRVIHHWVGQMLLTGMHSPLDKLRFWVRDKKQSSAEIDFVHLQDSKLIPIEIKSGKAGKMYSLRRYMETASHDFAVRIYAGDLHLQVLTNPSGRSFYLLNLPYFLVELLPQYIVWMKEASNTLPLE